MSLISYSVRVLFGAFSRRYASCAALLLLPVPQYVAFDIGVCVLSCGDIPIGGMPHTPTFWTRQHSSLLLSQAYTSHLAAIVRFISFEFRFDSI